MNCEKYQDLLSDFIDGSLTSENQNQVDTHLHECETCAEARNDLNAIVVFCREQRGQYEPVPNERALWLRISNMIATAAPARSQAEVPAEAGWWFRLMNRRWHLSFPQLATSAAALVMVVSLVAVLGSRRLGSGSVAQTEGLTLVSSGDSLKDRYRAQQQIIDYWNQRVELNKTRWSPQVRETFEQNMSVIDAAVNDSMSRLNQNPHDGVSEDILNAALNDKVELLKEFAQL